MGEMTDTNNNSKKGGNTDLIRNFQKNKKTGFLKYTGSKSSKELTLSKAKEIVNSLKIDMDYPLGLANLMCEPDSYEIWYVFNLFGVVIRLDRYSDEDKMVIARDYLIPELKERFSIYNDQFTNRLDAFSDEEFLFTEKELRCIIEDYCQDAGVRNLRNSLEKLVRYAVRHTSEGKEPIFSVEKIRDILEPTVYRVNVSGD